MRLLSTAALICALAATLAAPARAQQASEIRISKGFGILYLPLIVMQDQKLIEAKAAEAGLGAIKASWFTFDGGNVINDAMIAGALDVAGIGAPGFITLWSKGKGNPKTEVIGVSGLSATSLYLNTNNPAIKTLRDFTEKDKIALPGVKTSLSAVVLQMAAAAEFGRENFAKLDSLTVGLGHPDALAALLAGKTEVNAHFTSPPFSYLELKDPKVHRVLNSVDLLGNITLDVVFANKRFTETNPKLTEAFLAALEQANEMIAKEPRKAADIFVRTSPVKVSEDEVLGILADKDTQFSTTPNGVMRFVEFMGLAGSIKVLPKTWQDLYIPQLHGKKGS